MVAEVEAEVDEGSILDMNSCWGGADRWQTEERERATEPFRLFPHPDATRSSFLFHEVEPDIEVPSPLALLPDPPGA